MECLQMSPCLRVSVSPCLRVSVSPWFDSQSSGSPRRTSGRAATALPYSGLTPMIRVDSRRRVDSSAATTISPIRTTSDEVMEPELVCLN
jgi:hypothetical protein